MTMLFGCDPCNASFEEIEKATRYQASKTDEAPESVEEPLIMTWNIKFGGGRIRFFFECPGDRVIMEEDEVIANLEKVAEKIEQVDPDILLLQEVDVESKRVAGLDQVQWLLDHTGLNHAAYASQWRASYVPKHGLGNVNSGNAVLSKWPIEEATRLALPLISEQGWLTRYFYLKRNILKTRIEIPGHGSTYVLNTHLSAFSDDGTRKKQVEEVEKELKALDEEGHQFVMGGDFNLIPPGSETANNFEDVDCEDEDFEPTDYSDKLDVLQGIYDSYAAAIPLGKYQQDNRPYLTYSADENVFWTRKLDYLFTNAAFQDGSGLVHQNEVRGGMETLARSDHAPVSAELSFE